MGCTCEAGAVRYTFVQEPLFEDGSMAVAKTVEICEGCWAVSVIDIATIEASTMPAHA